MTAATPRPGGVALYTPDILALAVDLADHPLSDMLLERGTAASRVCGSKVTVALTADPDGRITDVGAQVIACAIGQAAAALFLRAARGRDAASIATALAELERWLSDAGGTPSWPGVAQLAPAKAHAARHAAILLPWKAALEALSKPARAD